MPRTATPEIDATVDVEETPYPVYDKLRGILEDAKAEIEADIRQARDAGVRAAASDRLSEIRRAIKNMEEAEKIPARWDEERGNWVALESVQFGFPQRKGLAMMPPAIDEFRDLFPPKPYSDYLVLTDNPLEIANLDHLARLGCCERVPIGYRFALKTDGSPDGRWLPSKLFNEMLAEGMVRQ